MGDSPVQHIRKYVVSSYNRQNKSLNYSGMVLFFCTFIALRALDCGRPVSDIKDYELSGETELYGGYVLGTPSRLIQF